MPTILYKNVQNSEIHCDNAFSSAVGIKSFVLPFSRQSIDFPAVRLVFTFSVKILSHVSQTRPGMLNSSVIADVCLYSWFEELFTHFHQSDLKMGNLSLQNPRPKYGYFLNTVYRFIWCSKCIMKAILIKYVIQQDKQYIMIKFIHNN